MAPVLEILLFSVAVLLVGKVIGHFIEKKKMEKDREFKREIERNQAERKVQLEKAKYVREYLRNKCAGNSELRTKLIGNRKNELRFLYDSHSHIDEYLEIYDNIKEYEKEIKIKEENERLELIAKKQQKVNVSNAGKLIKQSIEIINNYSCKQAGIYIIVNKKTLDFYIGESQNMNFRRKTHLGELLDQYHNSILMQEHFNKYGKDVFEFYALEKHGMNEEVVRKYAEERWIKEYKPTYN